MVAFIFFGNFILPFRFTCEVLLIYLFTYLFTSRLHTRCGAWTHDSEIIYQMSQPGTVWNHVNYFLISWLFFKVCFISLFFISNPFNYTFFFLYWLDQPLLYLFIFLKNLLLGLFIHSIIFCFLIHAFPLSCHFLRFIYSYFSISWFGLLIHLFSFIWHICVSIRVINVFMIFIFYLLCNLFSFFFFEQLFERGFSTFSSSCSFKNVWFKAFHEIKFCENTSLTTFSIFT